MRSLRPTSILLGVLVDKVTFVAGAIALAGVLGVAAPGFLSLALALGLATITLGGYVAGRHARSNPLGHGFAVGVMAVVISSGRFL